MAERFNDVHSTDPSHLAGRDEYSARRISWCTKAALFNDGHQISKFGTRARRTGGWPSLAPTECSRLIRRRPRQWLTLELFGRELTCVPIPSAFLTTELDTLKAQGLYRHLRILSDEQKAKTTVDDRQVVNLSSNNYLGLTTHPRLRERALDAIRRYGVGSGSVRPIAGTLDIHMELERRLADFKKTEAVVVFQSGFTANAGTVCSDPDQRRRRDFRRAESRQHHRRLPPQPRPIKVFPHKDVDAARRILTELPSSQRKLLITDGVFSMDGDLGALPGLCALAEEFGCIMMVDDAHASGVFGTNGRGTIDHFGVHGRVDIQVGTLSKAIGVSGGIRRRKPRPDRVSLSPRPAVPVLDLASSCRGRSVSSPRSTCCSKEPEIIGAAVGQHAFLQGRPRGTRLRYRHQREPDHPGHRRRRRAGDDFVRSPVRRRASSRRASGFRPWRATKRAFAPS